MRILLVTLAVALAQAVPQLHIYQDVKLDCTLIPAKAQFCTKELGCVLRPEACANDPKGPPSPLNCTTLLAASGGAVTDASKAFMLNIKGIKEIAADVTKNFSKPIDTLGANSAKYDSALVKYNQTLTGYNNAEATLFVLQDQFTALQARCAQTSPPPPPTCAADLEKLQEKIAGQNATCAKMWVQLDLTKQVMDLSAGLVEDSEKSVAPATTQAVQSFQAMQSLLQGSLSDKHDALDYWGAIKSSCTGAPPSRSERTKPANKVARAHGKAVA